MNHPSTSTGARRARGLCAVLLAATVASVVVTTKPSSAAATPGELTHVSLLGDSTMAGMEWYLYDDADPDAVANNDIREIIGNSYDLTFSAESCRRIVNLSCVGRFGSRPLSLLPLIQTSLAGQLGQAMVIMAGYDDASITSAVDLVMTEAEAQGVTRVLWLTYRTGTDYLLPGGLEARNLYQSHNAELAAATTRHAGLQILDWNGFTADKPQWFSSDGIHLNTAGAVGLAEYIKSNLDALQPVIGRCRTSATRTGTEDDGTGDQLPPDGPRSGFTPIVPIRVLDTRDPSFDVDGKLGARRTVAMDLDKAVPADATSAVMSVTAVDSCLPGFLTVFPCGHRPATSNVNYELGRTTAGMVISSMTNRTVCVFASTATDVVVDVIGAFSPSGQPFHALNPTRFIDTRGGTALLSEVVGERSTSTDTPVAIRGKAGIPAVATAVWVNVTVADPAGSTVLLAYPGPCGSPPLASSVNARVGHNTASTALVGVGSDGSICVRTYSGRSHVVVDVAGWFGPGPGGLMYQSRAATRLLDTRAGAGTPTTAEQSTTAASPSVLNVTSADSAGPGFVTVRPCGDAATSSLINTARNEDTANVIAVAPGTNGAVCARASAASQIVIDQIGVFIP